MGAGRIVVVVDRPDEAGSAARICRVLEPDRTWGAELAAPGVTSLRTSGDHLVACAGPDRIVTATRTADGWTDLAPLPLPVVFEAVREVLLQDDLLVVDSRAAGFAIYEWRHARWILRHQAPARALKRLGRPVAINPRQDILVRLGGGYATLTRDDVGGWTKGPVSKIAPLYPGWSPAAIETIHFTDDVLALGAPRDATDAAGHAGAVTGRALPDSGLVFVSVRQDGAWSPFTTLSPPRPRAHERFGSVLGGSADGALLVGSSHAQSPALRPFVFARDEAGIWQLRAQLPDGPDGWMAMDGPTVARATEGEEQLMLYTFGDDLLTLPPPRRPGRRRTKRPTAEVTYLVAEEEGGMGELVAAHGDRVAVTVGAAVHVLRFASADGPELVTEHVITHDDELLPGALAVDGERVAIVWEGLGDRVATPEVHARREDGAWEAEAMGPPSGQDGGWAESCVVLAGDWLVYARRGDADGHPSFLCGWRRGEAGWTERFEVRWPRSPHAIDLDDAAERLLVASEWEDRVDVCPLTDAGPGEPVRVTDRGGKAVFHRDAVLVARGDGIHAFVRRAGAWQLDGVVELSREVDDDLVADGDHVYGASSITGGGGNPTGEVHVLRRGADGYERVLSFRDYAQGVEGYDVGGALAAAGDRVLVGFEHRFHRRGGLQIATLSGLI